MHRHDLLNALEILDCRVRLAIEVYQIVITFLRRPYIIQIEFSHDRLHDDSLVARTKAKCDGLNESREIFFDDVRMRLIKRASGHGQTLRTDNITTRGIQEDREALLFHLVGLNGAKHTSVNPAFIKRPRDFRDITDLDKFDAVAFGVQAKVFQRLHRDGPYSGADAKNANSPTPKIFRLRNFSFCHELK